MSTSHGTHRETVFDTSIAGITKEQKHTVSGDDAEANSADVGGSSITVSRTLTGGSEERYGTAVNVFSYTVIEIGAKPWQVVTIIGQESSKESVAICEDGFRVASTATDKDNSVKRVSNDGVYTDNPSSCVVRRTMW